MSEEWNKTRVREVKHSSWCFWTSSADSVSGNCSEWALLWQLGRMVTCIRRWPVHGFIRKGPGYCSFVEQGSNSHVSDFSMLLELRKYWGFSMTGIFVIPMITASGPISEDDGVLLPLETWWRGLAESSSLLMTEEEPREPQTRGRGGVGREAGWGWRRKERRIVVTEEEEGEKRYLEDDRQMSSLLNLPAICTKNS